MDLTSREKEITFYWVLDYDYKQIAKQTHLSENTVRTYINRIHTKMGVHSKTSLLLLLLGIKRNIEITIK
ncbi:helix-turn-helix transcriptional regulator [Paenibacillus sp. MZ04-78.2]|uniref:helix-turn-helix transcriptional regulator n=1 Tax=Paenibacillus sp. MZ04-78.2 TaxID=2962034 RepID=UPI0035CAE24E